MSHKSQLTHSLESDLVHVERFHLVPKIIEYRSDRLLLAGISFGTCYLTSKCDTSGGIMLFIKAVMAGWLQYLGLPQWSDIVLTLTSECNEIIILFIYETSFVQNV